MPAGSPIAALAAAAAEPSAQLPIRYRPIIACGRAELYCCPTRMDDLPADVRALFTWSTMRREVLTMRGPVDQVRTMP